MSDAQALEEFRGQLRAWLEANLERLPPDEPAKGGEAVTAEQIAASRPLQRKLYDAGYAGISYPKEYGGGGLTAAHDRVFREEARLFRIPQFGGAGSVTFTAIGASSTPSLTPARISPGSGLRRAVTATSG
jgi:alkylation response protein AidB-like acyl-CoA dehydrogenase